MVFLPPRHSKSETVSRLFSAYYLYRHPDRWVGLNSYAAELAYTLSRAARENYLAGGGAVKHDAKAVKHWETGAGGGMWSAGVGGPITGKGFHLGIIDDPLKNAEEASSEVMREKQKEWYRSTFYTREEPGGAIILIQTRWNEDDLSGWLLSEESAESPDRWHILDLPAIAEPLPEFPESCTLHEDWRQPGEALCPERYNLEKLNHIKDRIGTYYFSALYQQRPTPLEGGLFHRAWFKEFVPAVPSDALYVRYWDKAGAAPGKGDYTVGFLMARDQVGLFYLCDVVRGQWRADERNVIILQTAAQDKAQYGRVAIHVEQPPGLAKESTEAVIRMLAGFVVYPDPVTKDKVERAEPFSAQAAAGNVQMLAGAWNRTFLDELCAFPNAAHDDQVDAASGAFNKLAEKRRVRAVRLWTSNSDSSDEPFP